MKKSIFAKLLIMIMCLALVLCGCSSAADNDGNGSGKKNNSKVESNNDFGPATPEKKAEVALGKTVGAIFSPDADFGVLENAMESGKITIGVGEYVENVLYINTNDFRVVDELSLNIEGVELDAELYLDKEDLVVALPGVVEGAYGVRFDTLGADLKDSAIWDMMGVDYDEIMSGMDVAFDELASMLDAIDPTMGDLEGALEEALSNVNKTVTEGTVTIDGEDVDAVIVTYSLDSKDMQEMIEIMLDWFVDYYEDQMGSLADMVGEDIGLEDITQEIEGMQGMIDAFFEEADLKAELVVNINSETGYIMTAVGEFSGVVDGEEGGVYLNIDLGKDASKSDEYTMDLTMRGEEEEDNVGLSLVLERETDGTETIYDLTFSASEGDVTEDVFSVSLSYDSASYEYEISAEGAFAINGICKLTDDVFEISLDSISTNGEEQEIGVVVKVEAVSASKIPNMPKSYTNLLKMSEEEMMELIVELGSTFGAY
jgi:hypothetical protein